MIFSNNDSSNNNPREDGSQNKKGISPKQWGLENNYSHQTSNNYSTAITIKENTNSNDITDVITGDRLNLLSTTIDHLTYQINKRAKMRDKNITDLDDMLCEAETKLLNLDIFAHNIDPLIESKRTECYRTVSQIRTDKNEEAVRCWKDQSGLYTDLLKSIGEYKTIKRRSKILSGDYR